MIVESPALACAFRVGKRTVTITVPKPKLGSVVCMAVEWTPTVPRRLSRRELRQYRAGRDAALAELAAQTGLRTAVLEL